MPPARTSCAPRRRSHPARRATRSSRRASDCARYVIHAVGPVWTGGASGEAELLRSTYDRSFALALAQGDVASIAFPAISTGVYAFPKPLAAGIAMDAMQRHESWFERIVACAFDAETERLYQAALG